MLGPTENPASRVLRGHIQPLKWWLRVGKSGWGLATWQIDSRVAPMIPTVWYSYSCVMIPCPWVRLGPLTGFQPIEYGKGGGWDVTLWRLHYMKFFLVSWLALETLAVPWWSEQTCWGPHGKELQEACRKWGWPPASSQQAAGSSVLQPLGSEFCQHWVILEADSQPNDTWEPNQKTHLSLPQRPLSHWNSEIINMYYFKLLILW